MKTFISLIITVVLLTATCIIFSSHKSEKDKLGIFVQVQNQSKLEVVKEEISKDFSDVNIIEVGMYRASPFIEFLFFSGIFTFVICVFLIIQKIISKILKSEQKDSENCMPPPQI